MDATLSLLNLAGAIALFRGDRHPIGTPGIRVHIGLLIS